VSDGTGLMPFKAGTSQYIELTIQSHCWREIALYEFYFSDVESPLFPYRRRPYVPISVVVNMSGYIILTTSNVPTRILSRARGAGLQAGT